MMEAVRVPNLKSSPVRSRGFTAIEVAIFMISSMVVATLSTMALLGASNSSADSGRHATNAATAKAVGLVTIRGSVLAVRGDIDVDGDNSINLSGSDRQAVVKLVLIVTSDSGEPIDLTPPYTVDDTGIDPDIASSLPRTLLSLVTDQVSISSTAWTVTFPGTDDGDNMLELGERAEITVWLNSYDNQYALYDLGAGISDPFADTVAELLAAKDIVTLRLTPAGGSVAVMQRRLPLALTARMLLD